MVDEGIRFKQFPPVSNVIPVVVDELTNNALCFYYYSSFYPMLCCLCEKRTEIDGEFANSHNHLYMMPVQILPL